MTSALQTLGSATWTVEGGRLAPWPKAPVIGPSAVRGFRAPAYAQVVAQLGTALVENFSEAQRARTGLIVGTVVGSAAADFDFFTSVKVRGPTHGSPQAFVYTLPTAMLAEASRALGLKGPVASVSAGVDSEAQALVEAEAAIRRGRAEAMLVGVVNACWGPAGQGARVDESLTLTLYRSAP